MIYLLGYKNPKSKGLSVFKNSEDADYNCEEWVAVRAKSLVEAKKKYEKAFKAFQKDPTLLYYKG